MQVGRSKFTIGTLAGFLVGIFVAEWLTLNLWITGLLILIIAISIYIFWSRIWVRLALFCSLGLILGLFYTNFYIQNQIQNKPIYDKEMVITGEIVGQPKIAPTKIQVVLKYESAGGRSKIQVDLPRYPEYSYGQVLRFRGKIEDPLKIKMIDNFDYGRYLLDKNILGIVKNPENVIALAPPRCKRWEHLDKKIIKIVYSIGGSFQEILAKILPEPYASFQAGLLLGNRTTQIPDSLTSAFNRTGTTHIVAVSGYNVTIIISILALAFVGFGRKVSFWASLACIFIFVIMTGGSASVVRAGLLGGLVAWGRLEGRRANHLILILFTASVMLLFNPHQLLGDVSFQLSFLAFAGLMYISPVLESWLKFIKLPKFIGAIFTETMGAQIAVLPIIIYNFGIISVVAPLVNILVLPFVPLSMLLGFVAGIGGLIWLELGKWLAALAWILLKYIIVVVETFSNIPWAALAYKTVEWWWIPIYYILIIIMVNNKKKIINEA
ncbi:MAG: ComEC/Rec2 family competence protein [Candidatus Berkelbacteria bacterium]